MLRGRRDRYHRLGFLIPFTVAAVAAPIQIAVGDFAARDVYNDQPVKFASMECVYKSGDHQPEHLGGICTDGQVKGSISLPGVDSLLAGLSTGTEVSGLDSVAKDDRPPIPTTIHLAFDAMVGLGFAMLALATWFGIAWRRRRDLPATRWFLRAGAAAGIAAVLALECGWMVTEIGRQPWIVHGFMRTRDAVTPAQGIWWAFGLTLAIYVGLAIVSAVVLRGMAKRWREQDTEADVEAPYSPPSPPRPEPSP
jgi:cytochrome d ubiquinol oxidase subunit I